MPPEEKKKFEKRIRYVWDSPEDIPPQYANHIQITHASGNEFTLFFGYSTPLLTHGLTEEEIKDLPDTLKIKPLTQIIVTPQLMRTIVEIFQENLNNYDEHFGGEEK